MGRCPPVDLDEIDRRLLRALVEDAARPLRALAEEVGVSAPTVAARTERLVELGLLGPVRRDANLERLGTLVLVLAPPDEAEALAVHPGAFRVWRTQANRAAGLVLLGSQSEVRALHTALPRSETHVLTEALAERTPPIQDGPVLVACSQCGKPIEGEGIELVLGGKRYVACCPTCKTRLEERYGRHTGGSNRS